MKLGSQRELGELKTIANIHLRVGLMIIVKHDKTRCNVTKQKPLSRLEKVTLKGGESLES